MKIDLDRLVREATEDADRVGKDFDVPDRDGLRRYQLVSKLNCYTIPELQDALTRQEIAAERRRHARSLRKADFVNLLVSRALSN